MSEQELREAKGSLVFSQQLVDRMRQPQSSQIKEGGEDQEVPEKQAAPQGEVTKQEEKPNTSNEQGMLSMLMNEIRGLFKGKEDEEKRTQELVEKHNKDINDVKGGLSELLNEERDKK